MDTNQSPPRHELELLTEAELAALLKVCRRQLYKWRVAGRGFRPSSAADHCMTVAVEAARL